jgi:hypothetical protein
MDDNRDSITIVRVGNAAGGAGPQIYLAKGKTLEVNTLKNLEKHGAPKYSKIIMTPNAYMTDEAWTEAAQSLAKGIRAFPVNNWFIVALFLLFLLLNSLCVVIELL